MRSHLSVAAVLVLAAACASRPPDSRPTADDPVCLCNGDLPCVCVRVDASTPRADYQGKTFYFCSEECREEFERHPEKYAHVTR
ncbi:MAG TPA: YHS domain-containing protein [Planctomycetota bacterium]|nr:YHS domain-containing protein [Planctomycetota bacterium]